MEKQKTAVEWLVDEIENIPFQCPEVTDYYNDVIALFDQAKQMEKEQIEQSFNESRKTHPMIGFWWIDFQDYYKSKYGKHEDKAENND